MSPWRILFIFHRVRHFPTLVFVGILLGGASYGYEVLHARPLMTYLGEPAAADWNPMTWTRVLRNRGHMAGYSDLRGNPLWVVYKLTPVAADAPRLRRPGRFSTDWRNLTRIDHDDYTGSGYDRGHLAPNYAMSRLYGASAQLDSFLMTNISPQKPKLNQRVWQRLEEVEIDHFTRLFDTVWVFTGPVFDKKVERLRSSRWVEIPDAFYKIYAAPTPNGPRLLAFLVPQRVRGNEPLDQFVTSVKQVEALTGFDFLHQLEDALEARLEAEIRPEPWGLAEVARRKGRFN